MRSRMKWLLLVPVSLTPLLLASQLQGRVPGAAPQAQDAPAAAPAPEPTPTPRVYPPDRADKTTTNLYWGDTHLHTNYSPDAYINGNTVMSPDHA
jgi:hypothetical protein